MNYLINGLTKDEFIEKYNKIYFSYKNNDKTAEKFIQQRLESHEEFTFEETKMILAWKLGYTCQTDNQSKFPYSCNIDTTINSYGNSIDIQNVCQLINDYKKRYNNNDFDYKVFINDAISIPNIGYVYAITLLYFISEGNYPIYDKMAMKALLAIDKKKYPGESISYKELNQNSMFDNSDYSYNKYIELQKKYFDDNYKTNRKIDRALWSYGHLFKLNKK